MSHCESFMTFMTLAARFSGAAFFLLIFQIAILFRTAPSRRPTPIEIRRQLAARVRDASKPGRRRAYGHAESLDWKLPIM
jgi:hypothetical protein